MNLIELKDFFEDYSASTVIIACIIAVITLLLDKKLATNVSAKLLLVLPFLLGVLLTFVWESIYSLSLNFNQETIVSGLISGSLSCCVSVIIRRKKSGKALPKSKTSLVILGLVENYVKQETLHSVVEHIERTIFCESTEVTENGESNCKSLGEQLESITQSLVDNSNGALSPSDLEALALTVIKSLENHKK